MSEALIKEAAANGIWTLLAIALLFYTINSNDKREERLIEEHKEREKESKEREDKLMDHLDKTNDSHEKIASSMEKLENRMEDGFNQVWERIDGHK